MDPDTVLDKAYYPKFNGTREGTIAFLKSDGIEPTNYTVYLGDVCATISAAAYLRLYDKGQNREVQNEA